MIKVKKFNYLKFDKTDFDVSAEGFRNIMDYKFRNRFFF